MEMKSLSEKCDELQKIGDDMKAQNNDLNGKTATLEGELRNALKTSEDREISISEISSKVSFQSWH